MPNRIRELRAARGLTLEQLAQETGTSVQQLSRLEKGDRRLTEGWMRRIAPALSVRPADLLTDTTPNDGELIKHPEELRVLRFWRLLAPNEKLMIGAFARLKGLELISGDNPKKRRA